MLKARETVQSLPTYHPPLGGREGLRLDFNENTVGCSPRVAEKLREISRDALARYPERGAVEATVAEFLGRNVDEVLLTNGVDEGIHLLCETYLEPGDEVLIVVPTFAMYEIYARATGAKVISIPAGEDFVFPTDAVLSAISPRTRLIAIANPNNPTGTAVSRADLLTIAEAAPHAALLVDEAYFEFHDKTMVGDIAQVPNLFIARTFSKAYGLAGLRIGILAGEAGQMTMVRRVSSPYNVNAAALACLPEALADSEYVSQYVRESVTNRRRLEEFFAAEGIPFWPSRANFVLARFDELRVPFVKGMRERGILVRDRNSDYGCAGCVRVTAGTESQMDLLFEAMKDVLRDLRQGQVR
ncbi:histidinol phosphate aminotransferase apoenzyme [Candidatus Koribacter versatilis Ellin345]|uniref:Histidinol-phosphate aminotransferase n=1 Tax=Koribacter versatilis (strain Ellin345) TaxID=204669 RepID=Q1IKB5_KORVE|nr:histidinol-phosphate transaminase [Candidatus Koribacter versatilis]ABF42685.1 histidinol phosphate aminotransferase apoenzyme [Candidatus Koribacter versatilis Ellin345]